MKEKEKITANKVIVENGEIKTVLTEETQQMGMTVDEMERLLHEKVNKYRELLINKNGSNN